jgi:transposase
MRSWRDEILLRRPPQEDSRRRGARQVQLREVAHLFDVSLSSLKRYVRMARQGNSLAPKKGPGRTPKVDEKTTRLLNEDMKERPSATISERLHFLEVLTGKRLSYSTLWRVLKRLGFSRRKDRWEHQSETSF